MKTPPQLIITLGSNITINSLGETHFSAKSNCQSQKIWYYIKLEFHRFMPCMHHYRAVWLRDPSTMLSQRAKAKIGSSNAIFESLCETIS